MEPGVVTQVATNGAGLSHDFDLAFVGGTSENAARWSRRGRFGLWEETSHLNDIVPEIARRKGSIDEGPVSARVEIRQSLL
jgi:hypothetical protein